jgi:uncharacterized protein YbjQ (UPF0145 family)
MSNLINLIIVLILIVIGYVFGRLAENRHYRSIFAREKELAKILTFSEKTPPPFAMPPKARLVSGSVVISVDYFKRFAAGLRMIFGGTLKSYEPLLDRARREAILRMKQQASVLNAVCICNVRIETSSISKGRKNAIGCVEVYAYGTALYYKP